MENLKVHLTWVKHDTSSQTVPKLVSLSLSSSFCPWVKSCGSNLKGLTCFHACLLDQSLLIMHGVQWLSRLRIHIEIVRSARTIWDQEGKLLHWNMPGGVPTVAQQVKNLRVSMRMAVQSMASISGLKIRHCHKVWCRLAAADPIQPLAWEHSYAAGMPLKRKKKRKEEVSGIFRDQRIYFHLEWISN